MADKTVAQKLQLKPDLSAAFLHLPEGMRATLTVPADVTEVAAEQADFILNGNVAIDDVYSAVRMRLRKPGE